MKIEQNNEYHLSLAVEQVMMKLQSLGATNDDSPWGETFATLAVLLMKVREEEEQNENANVKS